MDFKFLSQTPLFQGNTEEETERVLSCLKAREKRYRKDEIIFYAGDPTTSMGLVLSGSVFIEKVDIWGNRSILDRIEKGQIFAETYACIPNEKLMVDVAAAEDTDVLFLNAEKLLCVCSASCGFHQRLIRNLLSISVQKNLNLSRRIFYTSSKSTRERLLAYLSYQAVQNRSREFDIPYNRQQLADYLNVDRSAMSAELGRMQKDGLIQTSRNHFCLLVSEEERAGDQ